MSRARSTWSPIAAVRGAVTVPRDTPRHIRAATARLLKALLEQNDLTPDRVVSALFTSTPDLRSDYPAHAARRLGWHDVPLLGAREVLPPGALRRVVRVLLTVSRAGTARLRPVYLGEAAALRPDLSTPEAMVSRGHAAGGRPVRVAIIGLGQIGGSIGLALAHSGWRRSGFDLRPSTRRRARQAGAIDRDCGSLERACADADLAVVAVPIDAMAPTLAAAARALPRGATLLDTGSARGILAPALRAAQRLGVRAVGGHPIAGSEGRGFGAARADLFRGATFCCTPVAGEVPQVVRALIRQVGARRLAVAASDHDRALARTSHLPYLVACGLRDLGRGAARRGLAGPTFRDLTRVAGSDPRVALGYCRANAQEIQSAWRRLAARVDRRVRALSAGRVAPPRKATSGTRRSRGGSRRAR